MLTFEEQAIDGLEAKLAKAEARVAELEAALVKIAESGGGDEQAHDWPEFYDSIRRFARSVVEQPATLSVSPSSTKKDE